jgi:hypothetical protein
MCSMQYIVSTKFVSSSIDMFVICKFNEIKIHLGPPPQGIIYFITCIFKKRNSKSSYFSYKETIMMIIKLVQFLKQNKNIHV